MHTFKHFTILEAKKKTSARERAKAAGLLFVTKDLAPSRINTLTTDKDINARRVKADVEKFWDKQTSFDLTPEQSKYMMTLLNKVRRVKRNGSLNVGVPPFEKKDVAQIAKDYSEVLAGMWVCTQYKEGVGKVNFPSKNSLPVADVLVPNVDGGVDLVSIKTKSGSPTSFKGIWDIAKESGFLTKKAFMKKLAKEEQEMVAIIEVILNNKVYAHAIEIAKFLYNEWDTDDGYNFGLDILAKTMGTSVNKLTDDSIEEWMRKWGDDVPKIRKKLKPFYDAIGRGPALKEWDKYATAKQRHKSEKIQSPLAYHLVDWLNELYAPSLTMLMNTFKNIVQINVDLDMKGNLSVKVVSFPEIKFKFSNAGNSTSSRNKIGFKKL
jgi:hypothetical protein